MKKTLLLLLLLASSFSIFAQAKIIIDKANDNGERIIGTSEESIRSFTDKIPLSVSISATVLNSNNSKVTIYTLGMLLTAQYDIKIPEGGKILIKLSNDEIISLQNNKEASDPVGELVPGTSTIIHYTRPNYTINEDQLNKIASIGVKKIRIETNSDAIDKEFKKDKMGAIIKNQYAIVKDKISKDKKFSDDF